MRGSWVSPVLAAALVLPVVWLLTPQGSLEGAIGGTLLVEGMLSVAAFAAPMQTVRRVLLGVAALIPLVVSMLAPALWPASASTLVAVVTVAALLGSERQALRDGAVAVALGAGAAALMMLGIALAGGADSRRAIVGALALGWPGPWRLALVAPALAVGAWLVLRCTACGPARASGVLGWGFAGLAALVGVARLVWIASYASLPADLMVWSEPPFLLDQLKLEQGHVLYGPLRAVNSYPYAPLLQLVHHALLAPFGLDLSLMANRALVLFWQLVAAAVLLWALRLRVAPALGGGALSWMVLVELPLLAVGSSFIAPYVHPDHALMLCFAIAIATLVAEQRIPRPVFVLLLVVLPALATAFKLTGAGIGVGLVLVVLVERRWRDVKWLVLAALIALGLFPLFDHTLGAFSAYAFGLFASQSLRWRWLLDVPFLPAGRLALLAAVLFGISRWYLGRDPYLRAAARVAWLSGGFMTTSILAFLKVGGRQNDLMPLGIGASVVVVLTAAALAHRFGSRVVAPAAVLGVALVLVPPEAPCPASLRVRVVHAERTLEALVRSETAAGHCTLLYSSTLAWLDAGRRDVPLDRAQSAIELYAAHRPELSAHFARLDHVYDSVITLGAVFQHGERWDARFVTLLKRHLLAHYAIVLPRAATRMPGDPTAVILLRRVHVMRR